MKKLFLLTLLAMTALAAHAQESAHRFSVEPRLGVGYSTTGSFDFGFGHSIDAKVKGGLSFEVGADLQYQFSDKLGVSAGVGYFLFTSDKLNDYKFEMTSIDVPVLLHYSFNKKLSAFTGVRLGVPMSVKDNVGGNRYSVSYAYKTTHFMLPLGVKWSFDNRLTLSAQYAVSLTPLNQFSQNGSCPFSPLMLNLGYRFDL